MTPLETFRFVNSGPWTTSGEDVQWCVKRDPEGKAWLVFQGSVSQSDWLHNFDFPAVPYRGSRMRVHAGFAALWQSVRDELLGLLGGVECVWVGGYSQGAALATLALEDLRWHGHETHGVVFGSPRVLWMPDREIRARFEGLDRWAVRGDIVTHLAPAITGYRHVGALHEVGPASLPRIVNHFMPSYIEHLGEAA